MTTRRSNKPTRPQRPFRPIPVITEKYASKPPSQGEAKPSLAKRFRDFISSVRNWFGRKPKPPKRKYRSASKWVTEPKVQAVVDLARHKANMKARNRQKRKDARKLHQKERRRAS